jgi:hypothetical protein
MNTPYILILVEKPSQYPKEGHGRESQQWPEWLRYVDVRAKIATLCEHNKLLPEFAVLLPLPSALHKAMSYLHDPLVANLHPTVIYMDSIPYICEKATA